MNHHFPSTVLAKIKMLGTVSAKLGKGTLTLLVELKRTIEQILSK